MVDPNRSVNLPDLEANDGPTVPGSKDANRYPPVVEREEGELDEGDEEEQLYCICRTSDTSTFMIGCDNCNETLGNEWYHGSCISITAEYAKKIKQFYCLMCRDKDSALAIQFKETKPKEKSKKKEAKKKEPLRVDEGPKKEKEREKERDKEIVSEDMFGERVNCDPDYEPEKAKQSKYFESEEEEEEEIVPKARPKKPTKPVKTGKGAKGAKGGAIPAGAKKGKGKKKGDAKHSHGLGVKSWRKNKVDENKAKKGHKKGAKEAEADEGPKQCHGPGCVQASRKGSRFCGDECGMKLATNRIIEILPHRIRQWQNTASVAEELSSRELEQIRSDQHQARKTLEDLDKRQQALEELLEKATLIPPLTEDEANEEVEAEGELSTYCVTCGHEVSYRIAIRHMERCFNKYEGQTSYGSVFKTKIDNLFCDVFNPHQKTYCKRLRILCPEHSKDPKIGDEEICGYPLVVNCFQPTGSFCRDLKKKCSKHFLWEKLRRAEIDMERVQQWLKIDELFEKEQKIRFTMANRGGVLGLMLHQTIVHND